MASSAPVLSNLSSWRRPSSHASLWREGAESRRGIFGRAATIVAFVFLLPTLTFVFVAETIILLLLLLLLLVKQNSIES